MELEKFNLREYLWDKYRIPHEDDLKTWGLYLGEIEEMLEVAYRFYKEQKNENE